MKRLFFLMTLCPVSSWAQLRATAKYIVLITIDGLRSEFYLDPSWGMVNLRHLMTEGVAAKGVISEHQFPPCPRQKTRKRAPDGSMQCYCNGVLTK